VTTYDQFLINSCEYRTLYGYIYRLFPAINNIVGNTNVIFVTNTIHLNVFTVLVANLF